MRNLSEYLVTKFYHDCSGLISVVNSCVDLVNSDNDKVYNKAMDLANQSKYELINRLKIFNYLYGIHNVIKDISISTIYNFALEYLRLSSKNILLTIEDYKDYNALNLNIYKLIMCMIVIAHNNIIQNGKIDIAISNIENFLLIDIDAIGGTKKYDIDKINILLNNTNMDDNINIYNCHEYYTLSIMHDTLSTLKIIKLADRIKYKIFINGENNG